MRSLVAGVAAFASLPAFASEGHLPHSHTHSRGEIDENQGPLLLQATYTGEVMSNASGGIRRGSRYLDNLDLVAEADLEALAGWKGASVHVYGLYNNGKSFSDLAGDAQTASNIETGVRAFRLYEAWIEQAFAGGSLKVGLYDLNSEFDSLDASGLFIGSPHGIGTDFAQTGENGPSIFPSTSLAARLSIESAAGWVVRAAVLDGVPGDPDHPKRTAVKLGNGDGALLVAEVEAPLPHGRLLFGGWRYTARFDDHAGNSGRGNDGLYVRGETALFEEAGDPAQGLAAFARLGIADGRFNTFRRFASAGLNYTGPFRGRDEDQLGLAVAAAFTSDAYKRAVPANDAEVAFELTYRAPVASWLSLQPSAHYIINPGADPSVRSALAFGLRAEISFNILG
ncbi:carbohydrate porin [Sphingosinicella microcystinivorans]|uniref:carbohydrate porin n=1 Tax=Sphingosinicella microcystinivorans TaxID=335406 RepID=UPI0022F3B0CA|nr:carbohydrate porin [Sphingosinicella microcystinivorans]WBX85119.1 carbohydrate porin [Sphingosinicella microcystinivorans]